MAQPSLGLTPDADFGALAAGRRLLGSIWAVAAAAVLPIAVFAFLVAVTVVDAQRKEVEQRYDALATATLTVIDLELLDEIKALQVLAADPLLINGDLRAFQAYARGVLQTQDDWVVVTLDDAESGRQLLNTSRPFDSAPAAVLTTSERGLPAARRQLPAIGSLSGKDGTVDEPHIRIEVPVVRDGETVYVLSAAVPASRIGSLIRNRVVTASSRVTVLDDRLTIIANSTGDALVEQSTLPTIREEALNGGSRLFRVVGRNGAEHLRLLKASQRTGWYALVGEVGRTQDLVTARTLVWIAVAGGAAMVLSAVFAVALGARFGRRMAAAERKRRQETELARRKAVQAEGDACTAKALADKAALAKSRLFAAASHDLRQPLQAMSLFLDFLRPRMRLDPERTALAHLDKAHKAAADLLNSLLDMAKLDAGILVPQLSAFAASDLLDAIVAECQPQAHAKGLRLICRCSGATIVSDRVMLARILRNLVLNAIRYTENGAILLACRRRDTMLALQVWDSGPGIPADKLDLIWEEFYQLDNEARDRTLGLGLGLSIVQRLAQTLGHEVSVQSRLGKGSVFSVSVPVAPVENPRVRAIA
jgi:signal transduction histidine kinase